MPNINKSKIVPYTQKEMYELVNDVKAYPKFVPFCSRSDVHYSTAEEVRATLLFSRGPLSKSFTTLNRLQPNKMIEIILVNGPFKHLQGFWRFEVIGENQCRVSLDLEFEFASHWLALMFGPLFSSVAMMLVDSFCNRADVIHGKNK